MIIWILLKLFKNFCGEDEYQKSRTTDTLPYIFSQIKFKENVKGNVKEIRNIEEIRKSVKNTYSEYFSKKDEKAIKYEDSVKISESSSIEKERSFELYLNQEGHSYYLDHRYFSGLFFMLLAKHLYKMRPLNVMKEIYIPFLSEFYVIKFIIYMFYFSKSTDENLEFVEDKSEIRRETFNFDIENLEYQCKKKYKVLYHILSHIRSKVSLKRPLKVLIPVAFEATEERYNNVGAIFCYFDGNIESLIEQIENNKYHANASNLLQRFMNSGKKARNLVDVVLSCGCLECDETIIDEHIVTYENIADYPIYCLTVTYNNEVKSTITWMCK